MDITPNMISDAAFDMANIEYELGQAVAYEEMSKLLLDKATEYFRRSRDEDAKLLRNLAEICKERGSKIRESGEGVINRRHAAIQAFEKMVPKEEPVT